jgi:hypothetical protein
MSPAELVECRARENARYARRAGILFLNALDLRHDLMGSTLRVYRIRRVPGSNRD